MPEHGREHRGHLDHPGDRPPEETRETFECADVMLGQGILAVLCEPPCGLCLCQAAGGFRRLG